MREISPPLFTVLLKGCKENNNIYTCYLYIRHCSKCFILTNSFKRKVQVSRWMKRLKEWKMGLIRRLVLRGPDKEIMVTLWQRHFSWTQGKNYLAIRLTRYWEKVVFCTVIPKGHLLREGAKVHGSQKKANEADWLNANWQNMAQMSPSPRGKPSPNCQPKGHIEKVGHESWVRA